MKLLFSSKTQRLAADTAELLLKLELVTNASYDEIFHFSPFRSYLFQFPLLEMQLFLSK